MKKILIITLFALSLSAFGQASTNLSAQMQTVWTNLPPSIQTSTLDTWSDYQRAVNRSPEFQGITTNTVTVGTNTTTTITTNHSSMTFVVYFQQALQQEKIGRIIEQRNQELRAEMYRKVGQTVVQAWP